LYRKEKKKSRTRRKKKKKETSCASIKGVMKREKPHKTIKGVVETKSRSGLKRNRNHRIAATVKQGEEANVGQRATRLSQINSNGPCTSSGKYRQEKDRN